MNLNTLRLFVAVIQHGSLSKASERLNVPIATISRQIADLEKELNIQLFDRQKSGVKPTMAGQRLYEQVHLSIENLVNAEQLLFAEQQQLQGKLRISASPACEPVLDWIAQFQMQYPQIQVHCTMTDRVLDLSADGIDVAFRIGNLHGDGFIAKKVGQLSSKWVAHPDLLARYGTPTTLNALDHFPLAVWAKNDESTIKLGTGKQAVEIPYFFASNDSYALECMVKRGKAIAQLADFTVERLVAENGLVEVLSDVPNPHFDLTMIYAAHRYPSTIVRTFVDFISKQIKP
ncbi:Transcriptional regulator, LysR [Bibersteinia trehalosi USDA-ARS-USMARC-190]|uniref:Transcriptional regulator, LysR n=1 Tax=Bibersteinia trehalosi USDA-ARS-USMARC-190 TaxID=1263832 RepID=W0R3G9_BIBTR|nr:LysR family transcriptional regulator [Bibersteinia trehalosi]AHG85286.1 Transcriptional regulator, LysR [Bibersteinia trehalosi USDA-ARS-USMARC-190]